ncbi:hypothetical protein SAMN05428988_3229 [Chitinophaga sp. YR573]|uniref:hypothetical protein n=1 Tax=Chitinophaga sp. YR573 TaxID=1881040 RepID=UPI0008ACC43A|nr:hypothetical protein [Chitinophaga sp. YR573]SEW21604.1 hypothetical protein SAMN05428988_3229 [Chitinophaga sp. YR573]
MIDKNVLQGSSDLSLLQSNYVNGDPTTDYANSVLNKYKPSTKASTGLTPFSGGTTPATQVPTGSDGARYPYYSPFVPSNEDLYASYQSWYSKAGNGIMKGAGLAGTTFLNGTAGLIVGIGSAVSDGKMSSFYDNEFTRSLDDINKYMEDRLPNYYTTKEQNADWYSPSNLFTANFLFDKVIKNLGFSVGAIGAGLTYGAALRSLGLFSKVASAGGLARAAELSEQMASAVPQMQQGAAATNSIRVAAGEFLSGFNTLNTAQRAVVSGLSTIGEANFEALLQLNDYRRELISNYVTENGVRPTGKDLDQINQYAEKAGNTIFALNVPLLTATNYIQLPKILGSSYQAEKSIFSSGVRNASAVAFDKEAGKFTSTIAQKGFGKMLNRAKNVAGLFFAPSEAFEELSQTSFNFGVENYYNKARQGKDTDFFSDLLGEGYRQGITTKEGLESALIGGLSGGIFELRHQIKERGFTGYGGSQAATNKAAINLFNNKLFSGFLSDTRDAVDRGGIIQMQRMEAIRRGDFLEAKELQTDFTLNYLAPRIKYGRFDLVKDDISTYRQLASTPEGLRQLKDQGIIADDTTSEQLLSRISNMETHADNVNHLYQSLNIRYSGQKDKDGKRIYPDEVIDKMVYAAAKVSDYDMRVPALSSSLIDASINVQPILDEMAQSDHPSEATIRPAIEQIKNLNILADKKDDIRADLRDLVELTMRRKQFLKEYDSLKNKPEEYITKKYGPVVTQNGDTEIIIPQVDQDGKSYDYKVKTGSKYGTSTTYQRNGNAFVVNPELNIVETNPLGEIRTTLPDGQTKFLFPAEMSGYKLSDPLTEIEAQVLESKMNDAIDQTVKLPAFDHLEQEMKNKTLAEKLDIINFLDDKQLADELEKAFGIINSDFENTRKSIQKLTEDPVVSTQVDKGFAEADGLAGTTQTTDPAEDKEIIDQVNEDQGAKKHITTLFRSSTSENSAISGVGENDDFHRRANKLLNNIDDITDKENIRVAVVTFANQKQLGLEGLIPDKVPGSTTSSADINEGIIRLVFIRSTSAGDYFVDQGGNNMEKVGTKPDFNKLVYTTMPSTSLTWKNYELRYISTGKRASTPAQAGTYQDAYRIKRTSLLSRATGYEVFPFSVSKGFASYDKTGNSYAVTESLVPTRELSNKLLIIPTQQTEEVNGKKAGSIIHNDQTIYLPLGRPILQRGATLVPLNNRKLTGKEKQVIKKLIVKLADGASKGTVDKAILNYFQGLLYWKKPSDTKAATKGQIWYSKGYLYLGSSTNKTPFLPQLLSSSPQLEKFLDDVYVSANNFLLTQRFSQPFNEIVDIDSQDNPVQVQWKSYQHFLLSGSYITTVDDTSGLAGTARATDQIPFTTDIAPVAATSDKYAATFQGRYVTLQNFDIFPHTATQQAGTTTSATVTPLAQQSPPPGESITPVAETADFEPIIKAGDFVLDGVTLNLISFEGKKLASVAATFSAEGVQFTDYKHLRKKALTEDFKASVLQIATVQINQAVLAEIEKRTSAAEQLTVSPESNAPSPAVAPIAQTADLNATEATNTGPQAESNVSGKTAEEIFKNLRPNRSGNDIAGGQYRIISHLPSSRENIPAFKDYLSKVLPAVPLRVVDNLISTTDGGYAWGVFRDNAIYLYEGAEIGTGYHEAFEAVYGMFLSSRQQQEIIKEFKKRSGSFIDRVSSNQVSYNKATDHQAKEQIAEEFREFNLSGTLPERPAADGFFKRLLNFIKSVLLGKAASMREIFSRINEGYYSRMTPPYANRVSAEQYSRFIPGLNTRFIQQVMEGMTSMVFEELFSENRSLVEFDEYHLSVSDLYKKVYDRMQVYFDTSLPEGLLADIEDAKLDQKEAEKTIALYTDFYNKTWLPISNNWQKLLQINESFLKPFNLIFETDLNQEELEAAINNPGKNQRDYERDILKISARKNAASSIKLLFATLTQVEDDGYNSAKQDVLIAPAKKLSSIKLPQLVNYARTFNRMLYEVVGSISPSDMISKIKGLARKDKTYIRLYNRLKTGTGYDNLSLYDWKLLIKLYSVSAKQRPDFFIQIQDEGGRTYLAGANENRQTSQVISSWLNNLKANAGNDKLIYVDTNRYRVNPKKLAPFTEAVKQPSGKISFLNSLGIDFTSQAYDLLSDKDKRKFNDATQRLFNQLLKTADIATLSGRSLGITGALTKLAEVYVKANGESAESQHFNIDGEPVQNLLLHNYVSTILNDLNYYPTKSDLVNALPHLSDSFSTGSLLLENGGVLFDDDGNRRPDPINISIIEGMKPVGPRAGTSTEKLSLSGRRLQEFNQNLNGIYYVLLPADSRTEWSLNLDKFHYIPYSDLSNPGVLSNKVFRIFGGYLQAEMELVSKFKDRSHIKNIRKQGTDLRFFKGILGQDLHAKAIAAINTGYDHKTWISDNRTAIGQQIKEWFDKREDELFNYFRDYEVIKPENENLYTFSGLDSDFKDDNKIPEKLTEAEIRSIIRFRTLNYSIQNTEFHKIFFGDPALYSDPTKRIKSFLSGRETTYHSDPYFNTFANNRLNATSLSDDRIMLKLSDPGYWEFKDYMVTATVADIEIVGSLALDHSIPENLRAAYENANEADAQSWITLPAYRELLLKSGGRWTDAMERQYQYEMAYERLGRSKTNGFSYENRGDLRKHDEDLVKKGNPQSGIFHVIKPIGTGVKAGAAFADIFLDKTSAMPIYYRMSEGRGLGKLYGKMSAAGISYAIMESGRKVGAEFLNPVYQTNGDFNPEPFSGNVNVPFKYFGIQLETAGTKHKQTRGTQLTKLAIINLLASGIPQDISMDAAAWNKLSETEKIQLSPSYKLISANIAILKAMADKGYQQVLDQLGISETENGFHIADKKLVAAFISREAEARDLPDNFKSAIGIDAETGDFKISLEAISNYRAVKSIIYSIVDKKLLSPKMPGGPKVQVSSALFERNNRQAVYKPAGAKTANWERVTDFDKLTDQEKSSVRLTSSDLKFYTRDAPYIEVYMPHWFREKLLERGSGKTDQELIDYLNSKGSDLLTGIGFRIPTQELNSVEHIKIKGFLPQEMGDTIIVPSEIVLKAGSDFDIDKLNTYLKNFYIGKNGFPEPISFVHADTQTDEGLKVLYNHIFGTTENILRIAHRQLAEQAERGQLKAQNKIGFSEEHSRLIESVFSSLAEQLKEAGINEKSYQRAIEKYIPFDKFSSMVSGKNIYQIYSMFDSAALENEYIRTLQQLLSLPENFERLIQPNSADELVALRGELNQALGIGAEETKGNFSLLLDPFYMSQTRHNFLSGKDGVGIAALQQTNTALSQLAGIVLDHRNFNNKLSNAEKSVVKNITVQLPHNTVSVDGEEFISISAIKDTIGKYISDKISSYINGYVDVAKDPFIIELGASLNVASTYMFLEKIGVPTRDVIFFMNQPIIKDYLRLLSIKGFNTVFSEKTIRYINQAKGLYPTGKVAVGAIDTSNLKTFIEKKSRGKKFSDIENGIQQQILDEFLKYSVFSGHLFKLTQGSNYDTDYFSDASLVFRKQTFTRQAREGNLFNSIDKLLDKSFIGTIAQYLGKVKSALGEIFLFDRPSTMQGFEQILSYYLPKDGAVSEDDFLTIASKLQSSFLDFITQLASENSLNTKIQDLLLGQDAVAAELVAFKKAIPAGSDLSENTILKLLEPVYDDASTIEPQNVKLTEKAYDSYTSNLYTEAMRELRDNVHSAGLYKRLILLSLVQSGSRRSPISFTDIIPVEDYAPIVTRALENLSKGNFIRDFVSSFAFQRVHYWDERVVPTVEPKEISTYYGSFTPLYEVPTRLYKNLSIVDGSYQFIQLSTHFQSRESNYPVVKIRQIAINPVTKAPYTPVEQAQMRKNGDYSFFSIKLFQKVMMEDTNGNDVALSYDDDQVKRPGAKFYIYKQINAWGKPGLVLEYYDHPRVSVLPSNQKIDEFSDAQVIGAFQNRDEKMLQLNDSNVDTTIPSKAGKQTLDKVYNFLEKIGVQIKDVNQIVVNGKRIDASAVADILNKTIQVVNGKHDTALPEEAMHFAVELVQQSNPQFFKGLLRDIGKFRLYNDILSLYGNEPLYQKDGKPDILKLKKEAIARVLVEVIINKSEGINEKPELLAQVGSWWERIISFLKNLFSKGPLNLFETAAGNILNGQFSDEPITGQNEVFFQLNKDTHQSQLSDKLLNLHSQLSKEVSATNGQDSYYVIGGKRVSERVTNLSKLYYERKFRNKQISETELQKAINDQKKEKGTDGHADLEDIFHRMIGDDGFLRNEELLQTIPSRLSPTDNSFYRTLENNMRERLRSFKAGTRFFSELMIYDEEKDMAGTIDFLAIEPDNADGTPGKIHILDWKFVNLKEQATDIPFYKKEAWNIQISEYLKMLSRPVYGAVKDNFGMTRAIPIKALYSFEDNERTKLKLFGVEIGNVNVKAITDDTLLPVPTKYESTGNKDLDKLIFALNSLHEKIFDTRSDPGAEYLKNQRLNDITTAIRRLQMKKETETLFKFAKNDIYNFNAFFRKYFELLDSGKQELNATDVNELSGKILDAEDVLTLYKDFNVTFRKIFSYKDAESKPILQESEMISDDAELVLSRIITLANNLRVNSIARGLEVEDVLEPEKVVTWYQKWVRSLSQGATKATEILWEIVKNINTRIQIEFSEEIEKLISLEKKVSEWLRTSGLSFKELQDMIFQKDAKGRWNGKVISTTSPEFYAEMTDALTKKNASWVMGNIDLEAYNKWYKEEMDLRKKNFETSRLHEDEKEDAALKIARLQDFKKHFDIMDNPDTAISLANYKLKAYPDLNIWKSKEFARLHEPHNEPVLALYNFWIAKLEESYKLGMLKSWERKTFFPNVRKDFLDKIVFGAESGVVKSANLNFLNSVRIDNNDEVFGYTDINGNPQDKLSSLYHYDLGEKILDKDGELFSDYANKSTDIFKVMALWEKEIIKYRHKSEVVDTVRLLHFTEKNRQAISRSKRTGGIAIKEDGEPVLIDNVENTEYFKNYMDYYFYGKRLSEGQDVTFQFKYNRLAKKVNEFFKSDLMPVSSEEEITISGKKMIRATNRFFQMKVLGLNLATALTNYLGGKANAYMLAGKYFTKSDYTKGALQLASAKFHTEEGKIHAGLLNYFLPLTEDRTGEQIKQLSVSKAVKLLSSDHLFYLMRTSDKGVQYPAALAMFSNTMVNDGKLVNIRQHVKDLNNYGSIYSLSGPDQQALRAKIETEIEQLKNTKSLPVVAKIENDKIVLDGITRNSKTVADLRNNIQQFSKDALGNMSEDDISQYRMTLLGQSFMMFKNWIPRMADVRFGEFRYQIGTDSYEWGRVAMLFNALRHGILTGAKASIASLAGKNEGLIDIARKVYLEKKRQAEATGRPFKMTEADFVDMYVKGIRTQLKEVGLMMSMLGMLMFAKSEVPDDDDDRTTGVYKWLTRTLDKMTDELGFFLNPLSFTAIANGSVFPSVQLINDIVRFTSGMTMESYFLLIGDEKGAEKNKVMKYLFKTFPVSKELMTYVAMFNEDLAREYGITITSRARIR